MLAPTPDYVAVEGLATVTDGVWSLATATGTLYAQIGRKVGGRSQQSPRERHQIWLRYPNGYLASPPPAGSVLSINGVDHEVCEDAAELSVGTRHVGWELKVVSIAAAYPTAVEVRDSAGAVVAEGNIAMWMPKEDHDGRGEREDREGEAPATLYSYLVARNCQIAVGTQIWRVTSCVLDTDAGRVLLRLRNTRGGN